MAKLKRQMSAYMRGITSQPSRQGVPERHRRNRLSIAIPDAENLSRHVLVPHDPFRNEVPCTCDRLREGHFTVGKVDPVQVLHNLIAVENVEIKAWHGLKPYSPGKGSRPPQRCYASVLCRNIGSCTN